MEPLRFSYDLRTCSLKRVLSLIGDKWALLAIREAFYGVHRFDDFARAMGCGRAVLSARLKLLTEAGILRTRAYREPGRRARQDYRLTEKGSDLFTAFLALSQWGDRWMPAAEGPAVTVTHGSCGHPIEVAMRCTDAHGPLALRDLKIAPGPGARPIKVPAPPRAPKPAI